MNLYLWKNKSIFVFSTNYRQYNRLYKTDIYASHFQPVLCQNWSRISKCSVGNKSYSSRNHWIQTAINIKDKCRTVKDSRGSNLCKKSSCFRKLKWLFFVKLCALFAMMLTNCCSLLALRSANLKVTSAKIVANTRLASSALFVTFWKKQ